MPYRDPEKAAANKKEYKKKWMASEGNRERYKVYHRERHLRVTYGISSEEYSTMLGLQNGVCSTCGLPSPNSRKLSVDHDHVTGAVRSLLCVRCNSILGLCNDNPAILTAALSYLRDHA